MERARHLAPGGRVRQAEAEGPPAAAVRVSRPVWGLFGAPPAVGTRMWLVEHGSIPAVWFPSAARTRTAPNGQILAAPPEKAVLVALLPWPVVPSPGRV